MNAAGHAEPFHTVIAGGGVAGLEAALALRELAAEQVATTLLTPSRDFVYRPMTVLEPFCRWDSASLPPPGNRR